jgi:hypothetical protein
MPRIDMRPSGMTTMPCGLLSGCWSIHIAHISGVSCSLGILSHTSSGWQGCQLSACSRGNSGKRGSCGEIGWAIRRVPRQCSKWALALLGHCVHFALARHRCEPIQVGPLLQHLALGLSPLHHKRVLCLGNEDLCHVKGLVVVLLVGRPKEAFPLRNCLGKSMVGWPHGVMQWHHTQVLVPLSGLGRCSCTDSIVHLGSVKAPGEHGIHGVTFIQCLMPWDHGELRHGGVELVMLTRWWQWWPVGVDFHWGHRRLGLRQRRSVARQGW